MKVVLFGDSLLAYFYKEDMQALESKVPGSDVYNCAVGGWDTDDGVAKASYIATLHPDAVVLSFGTNDSAPWKQVSLERFRENIRQILHTFRDAVIVFFLPPPINEAKDTKGDRRTNALTKQYFDAARAECENNAGVRIVDSWALFYPLLEQGGEYHTEDGVHLNEYEQELLIDQVAKALLRDS